MILYAEASLWWLYDIMYITIIVYGGVGTCVPPSSQYYNNNVILLYIGTRVLRTYRQDRYIRYTYTARTSPTDNNL